MPKRKKIFDPRTRREQYERVDDNLKIIFNLRDVSHIMRALYEGKGGAQRIMTLLDSLGPMTQSRLTELLGIQPGSASDALARLERDGMLERTPSLEDRRTFDVALTVAGHEAARVAREARDRRHEEMFACLDESEKRALNRLLEKLYADWSVRYQ